MISCFDRMLIQGTLPAIIHPSLTISGETT